MSSNHYTTSCLIFGAKQIVQVVANKEKYVRGVDNLKRLSILEEKKINGDLVIVLIK
jgi:hypothetical protein